ncbi:uncharacterized protein LOC143210139 [Lasioglossum baleicum]|uniref:uncharacterized protein LOC143210139 n=1 Tax=Lasioglossum baleicum TaxID=434251 RepID=UPI003FCE13C1
MSSYKADLMYKRRNKLEMEQRYMHTKLNISSDREEEKSLSESQDFCLKMTQDSISSDSRDADNENVIVISDSSSDCDYIDKRTTEMKLKSVKHSNSKQRKFIDISSNSECLNDKEKHMLELWRSNNKIDFFNSKKNGNTSAERRNILLTSDSDTPSSSDTNEKFIESSVKIKSTYINLTREKNKRVAALSSDRDSNGKCMESSTKSTYISFTPENKRVTALSSERGSNEKHMESSSKSTYISFTPENKRVTALSSERGSNEKHMESSSKSTNISFTPEKNKKVTALSSDRDSNKKRMESSTKSAHISFTPEYGKNLSHYAGKSTDKPHEALAIRNQIEIKKKLTNRDVRNILKNISSPKVAYESPRINRNVVIDESIDDNEIVDESTDNAGHPAISLRNNLIESTKIIDETLPSSISDIVQDSQRSLNNFHRNRVNEILNTQNVDQNAGAMSELSARKKKQISEWLHTNSPDSKSDSSFSMVPASNKSGVSSGNSSLERLEMNYETPNNRDRIRQAQTIEKRLTNEECDKIVQTSVTRQTTILDYTKRSRNNALELRTPTNRRVDNVLSTPIINKVPDTDITAYAEILDKLYGTSWRQRADELLPKSEPRKQAVDMKSRAVQTERKPRTKKIISSSESLDEDSSASLEDLRPPKPSTKRNARVGRKQRDSFINDEVSSESGGESSYYTAVTKLTTSASSVQSKPTVTPRVHRPLRIYDTDSEDDGKDEDNNRDDMYNMRRKKLYFNDDESESESSSTSEFDPGDNVPPKRVVKKDPPKPPRQTIKKSTAVRPNSDNRKCEKTYSFLASLSENVPIASAHPEAKKYRTDFKNNKETLCNYLYKLYNEKVFDEQLPKDMSIEWNVRMRGTAGFCYNRKSVKSLGGVVRSSRIVLSTKVLDTPDRLRDTLIHEMCHAAAWLINSVSDGHGPYWTGWANKAVKTFPDLPPIRRCHDYKIKTKFTYKCVGCGYSIGRHSKSLDVEKKRCGHCYGKFELLINKTTKSGTVQVQTPKRELGGFALFVKQNYSSIKKDRNVKHAEIMKILGQQFSAVKIAKNRENIENEPPS